MPNIPITPERPQPLPISPSEPASHADLIELEIALLLAETELARILAGHDEAAVAQPEPVNVPAAFAEATRAR